MAMNDIFISFPASVAPQLGLRERKKKFAQAAIEDAALKLFGERGYDRTSIQDIADEVMMSSRTILRYFATKEDIVFASTNAVFAEALIFLQQQPSNESLETLLRAVFAYVAALYQQRWQRFTALYQIIRAAPELEPAFVYYLGKLELTLGKEFQKYNTQGLSEQRMQLLIASSTAAFRVAMQWLLENDRAIPDLVSLIDEYLTVVLNGQFFS